MNGGSLSRLEVALMESGKPCTGCVLTLGEDADADVLLSLRHIRVDTGPGPDSAACRLTLLSAREI